MRQSMEQSFEIYGLGVSSTWLYPHIFSVLVSAALLGPVWRPVHSRGWEGCGRDTLKEQAAETSLGVAAPSACMEWRSGCMDSASRTSWITTITTRSLLCMTYLGHYQENKGLLIIFLSSLLTFLWKYLPWWRELIFVLVFLCTGGVDFFCTFFCFGLCCEMQTNCRPCKSQES